MKQADSKPLATMVHSDIPVMGSHLVLVNNQLQLLQTLTTKGLCVNCNRVLFTTTL